LPTKDSAKNGGFPAFLNRSLESGWETKNVKVQQAVQNEQLLRERQQKKRENFFIKRY
jgi:hypothetical protein